MLDIIISLIKFYILNFTYSKVFYSFNLLYKNFTYNINIYILTILNFNIIYLIYNL